MRAKQGEVRDKRAPARPTQFIEGEDLAAGTLVQLLEDFPVTVYWLKALVPRIKMNRPAVRSLVAFLKESMQPMPPWER